MSNPAADARAAGNTSARTTAASIAHRRLRLAFHVGGAAGSGASRWTADEAARQARSQVFAPTPARRAGAAAGGFGTGRGTGLRSRTTGGAGGRSSADG